MHGWQANLKRTCAQPVVLGLRPKMKYPPLCGGIFIAFLSERGKPLPYERYIEREFVGTGVPDRPHKNDVTFFFGAPGMSHSTNNTSKICKMADEVNVGASGPSGTPVPTNNVAKMRHALAFPSGGRGTTEGGG